LCCLETFQLKLKAAWAISKKTAPFEVFPILLILS
jgi:hypothetical protein